MLRSIQLNVKYCSVPCNTQLVRVKKHFLAETFIFKLLSYGGHFEFCLLLKMLSSYNQTFIGFGISMVELYKNNQKTVYMLQNEMFSDKIHYTTLDQDIGFEICTLAD